MLVAFFRPLPTFAAFVLRGAYAAASVRGMRASMYDAVSLESVKALVDFMADSRKKHG